MLPAAVWSDLDAGDRCIQHAKAGPPISTGGYNNNIQIVQFNGKHDQIGRPLLSSGESLFQRQVSLNGGLFPTTDEPEGRPGHVY